MKYNWVQSSTTEQHQLRARILHVTYILLFHVGSTLRGSDIRTIIWILLLLLQSYTHTHTPIVLPQSRCTIEFLDNSYLSEPALELYSRAVPRVRGITPQSVQPQGEIQEEGRTEKKTTKQVHFSSKSVHLLNFQFEYKTSFLRMLTAINMCTKMKKTLFALFSLFFKSVWYFNTHHYYFCV